MRLNRLASVCLGFVCCASPAAWSQITLIQAVEATLGRHPQLEVERERVASARSLIKRAAGVFDTQLNAQAGQSNIHTPLTGLQQLQVDQAGFQTGSESTNLTTAGVAASRVLRTGIQLSASATLNRTTDNLAQTHGVNVSQFRFNVNLPLMRGRGRAVTTAEESAARIDGDASLYDLNHSAATLLADTATRYWEVVGAWHSLDVYQQAEARGLELASNVKTLIDADKLPRSEIQQVNANLAVRTTARAAAEQRLVEATQSLALAIGLPVQELMQDLKPSDPLPDGEQAPLPTMNQNDIAGWLQRSLTRRADYLSLSQRQGAFSTRRDAAANRLKPQFDLRLSTGYSGLHEGRRPDQFLASPFTHAAGVDLMAGLSYSLPIGRRTAQAELELANSAARQNAVNARDLARGITSTILAGIGAYKNAIIRVQQARAAVDASQAALNGEREKLRLGAGSVVNLITLEDRLTAARNAYVDAGLNYAILVARIRFATGTLIEPNRMSQTVPRQYFYQPPWEDK